MIGIIGSGNMGKSIAVEFACQGVDVVLVSTQRHLPNSKLSEEVNYLINRLGIDLSVRKHIKINYTEKLNKCELIIECCKENLGIKREFIKKYKNSFHKDTIVCSNTSSLSIFDIFNELVPLENVVGMHFFNPVHIMKLVEIVSLEKTSKNTTEKAQNIVKILGKEYVNVKDSPGFIVNRLLIPMINEAAKLLDEGIACKEDIDKAMKFGANHPIGPLKLSDLIGNDVTLAILEAFTDKIETTEISGSLKNLVESKKLGRKTKEGFYNYSRK